MKRLARSLTLVVVIVAAALAQTPPSPYSGQEKREIKALSTGEVEAYLNGRGMGFAKAAELNSYPGPMHVLELSGELELTEEQKAETQKIFEQMKSEAVRLGQSIVEKEAELDRLFVRNEANGGSLQTVVGEISGLQGALRMTHLRAHIEMKRLLSSEQVKKYDELRGYGSHEEGSQKLHHGHDGH
ncbi:MAG: periplasmic heavy metal sensor [candidate division Zixibacteria bacterium]|nr:periplasmic heavy metal sensor [candidate division Zixibacteria bacterium]